MLNKIIRFLKIRKMDVPVRNFFDFSSSKQKKIIKEAVYEANREQTELIRRYEKRYGKIDMSEFFKCEH